MHPHLEELINNAQFGEIRMIKNLHGGHGQSVLKLEFENSDEAVIKIFTGSEHAEKANAEGRSLTCINHAVSGLAPKVRKVVLLEESSAVVMDFVLSGNETNQSRLNFGADLAKMHQFGDAKFGFSVDTYIGGIGQNNTPRDNWAAFYIEQRLEPLFSGAYNAGRFNNRDKLKFESLLKRIESEMPEVRPVLLHGDLWNGNVIFTHKGGVLIDACAYFGHHEADLAMMNLFGGFHSDVLAVYHAVNSMIPGFREREKWYQLYYLLVHVLLFGQGYAARCRQCFS